MREQYHQRLRQIQQMECPPHFKIIQLKKLEADLRDLYAWQKKQKFEPTKKKENCQPRKDVEQARKTKQQIEELQAKIIQLKQEKISLSDCIQETESKLQILSDISLVRKKQNKVLDAKIQLKMQKVEKNTERGKSKSFFLIGGSFFSKVQEFSKPFLPLAK